jgi:hypothetical protein
VDRLREKNYLTVPGVDLSAFFKNGGYTPGGDDDEEDDLVVEEEEA